MVWLIAGLIAYVVWDEKRIRNESRGAVAVKSNGKPWVPGDETKLSLAVWGEPQ